MAGEHLKLMTEEERELVLASRYAKKLYAEQNLKLVYADMSSWEALASKYNVRLPAFYHPTSETKYMKRICKGTNTNIDDFIDSTGFSTLKAFTEANSSWNCRALCGILLEWVEDSSSALCTSNESA